jgi:hypothetical protein
MTDLIPLVQGHYQPMPVTTGSQTMGAYGDYSVSAMFIMYTKS